MGGNHKASQDTLAVHGGIGAYQHRPVVPPIYQSSTFLFENAAQGAGIFAGEEEGYVYTRMGNPTVAALEECIAALEGGTGALACASGMAAVHTALAAVLSSGDHLVCSDAVYGPTCTLIESTLARFGVTATFVDTSDIEAVRRAMTKRTKVVFVETPGNPTLVVTDLEAVSGVAHEVGAQVIVDNTLMSPALQQPLRWGADVVVHSLTKFLNGHADVVGGIIVVRQDAQYRMYRKALNQFGGMLAPFDAFLVHRGVRTLPLRMQRHTENATAVARFLESHPAVEWVRYPGLSSHPQHAVASRQMAGGGGLVSMGLVGGVPAGVAFIDAVQLFGRAVSLGGVESLVQHPASMTHASMGAEARARANISDGLVRLSVGIENCDDLIADLECGLAAAVEATTVASVAQ